MSIEIDNLEERKDYWSDQIFKRTKWRRATTKALDKNFALFKNKNVLEIGPGYGRQFDKIYPLAKKYIITDISQLVLDDILYGSVEKHLMTSYQPWQHEKVDITHFWYVLYHVKFNELNSFFKFVYSTLVDGGLAFFNFALLQSGEMIIDDGIGTTPMNEKEIFENIKDIFEILEYTVIQHTNEKELAQGIYLLRKNYMA